MTKTIHSMEEFEQTYFPKDYTRKKEEKILNGTPEEIGKYFAEKTIKEAMKKCSQE